MTSFVHHMHRGGQAHFTWGVVDSDTPPVHALYMFKKKAAEPLSPPDNFIKAWREHRGLTLEQLADMIGMSHASVQRAETGKQNYTIDTLHRIAQALGTNPVTLLLHPPDEGIDLGASWAKASMVERKQIAEHARSVIKWRDAS